MLFRNRRLVRGIACLLLLEAVGNIAAPTVSWALMGPGQPEFISYEAPGATDMVNLTTGDLTYQLPLLDVPGPERSFSLPLTYRAGIKLEQEASWVGLGWTLNPGAIARNLNNYPDDASNYPYRSTYNKELDKGWKGGIPGIMDLGWNSQTGHSGSVDLIGLASVGWEKGKVNSADLVGIKYSKGQGISVDPVRMAMAAATIVSAGASSTMSMGASLAWQGAGAVGTGVGMGLLGKKASSSGGFNRPTVKVDRNFMSYNYWRFYNDNKSENMYGSLYFQDMSQDVSSSANDGMAAGPTITSSDPNAAQFKAKVFNYWRNYGSNGNIEKEVGADISLYAAKTDKSYYDQSMRPVSTAHDDFSVMGEGVSGSIRPQRLEVGSVAYPRVMSNKHDKYSVVNFLSDYKVGFRYENSISSGYDYQQPTDATGTPVDYTGIEAEPSTSTIRIADKRLFSSTPYVSTRTEPQRKGVVNSGGRRGLVQGKHVQWYSNDEIISQYQNNPTGDGTRFLEFYKPTQQTTSNQVVVGYGPWICPTSNRDECYKEPIYGTQTVSSAPNPFRVTLPGKGIGAFAVTAEDGSTYHYSLPVYHYASFSKSRELVAAPGTDKPGESTTMMGEQGKVYAYATTWLLTAITSPDYVDRGLVGTVDSADWGGWVRFKYGKFSQQYKWSQPYVGETYRPDDMNTVSLSEGFKETYYLNSISTRTHTALFVKSVRNDARGHFTPGGGSNLGINEQKPSSSLRLDEIILLTNDDLQKLRTQDALHEPADGEMVIPALTTNTASNAATYDAAELANYDSYRQVLDLHDLSANARIRDFVNKRALKRVVFNYSYRLCVGTPNSFPSATQPPAMDLAYADQGRTGKLTLESVSIFGPLTTKLIPDTKFRYENNPAYGREKWDYFGMYASSGWASSTTNNHQVAANYQQASQDGAAWSLTEIVNPLGGRTRLQYERDQYSQVSEFGTQKIALSNNTCSTTLALSSTGSPGFSGDLRNYFKPGDRIQVSGSAKFRREYYIDGIRQPREQCDTYYSNQWMTIKAVDATTVTLNDEHQPGPNCPPLPSNASQETYTPQAFNLTTLITANRNGGDLRVAQVTTVDENNREYQTRYRYTGDGSPGRNATGVISKEPEFIVGRQAHSFEGMYDYPGTPVMYGKVTVLRGAFKNGLDSEHDQREEYTFFTPVSSMVSESPYFYDNWQGTMLYNALRVEWKHNTATIDVGKMGQPIAVRKFNGRGEQEFATTFSYTNELRNGDGLSGQGRFSEGVMTNELLDRTYYRINRTTKRYLPTIMTATTTVANGMRSEVRNELYDYFTGQVIESVSRNSLGDVFRTKTIPAYTLTTFQNMGAKGADPTNRNMLSQSAAEYVFKEKGTSRSLVSATVSTWKRDWDNYREYDANSDSYVDRPDATNPIWRMHESYVWQDQRLQPDGTYASFTDFNWSQLNPTGQHPSWQRTSVITRYDHFSNQLEGQDFNGRYSAQKLGHQQTLGIAAASNARYTEIAYSGAEDQQAVATGMHFGGEVRDGGSRSMDVAHTGAYSLLLTSSVPQGFTYKAKVGNTADLRTDRKYRASAWLHKTNASNGRLYASLNGTTIGEVTASAASTRKAGDWYLLNLLVTLPASATGQTLQVGCRTAGGTVYMDDFRFQPLTSGMAAYVYDAHTRQSTFALDNNNLFTRYQYDAAGKVIAVYKEVLDRPDGTVGGGKLVREASYNYARMKEPNWVESGSVRCVKNPADNSNTGEQEKQEKDVNPLSPTYNQVRWVSLGYTRDCPTCTGYGRWNGAECEMPVRTCMGSVSVYRNGTTMYSNSYRYQYSDGTSFSVTEEETNPCAIGSDSF